MHHTKCSISYATTAKTYHRKPITLRHHGLHPPHHRKLTSSTYLRCLGAARAASWRPQQLCWPQWLVRVLVADIVG
ncbi:hypothetical protein HanRHA438_Chr12g0564171 [Helianthus annuus]|nr:hypothetical protein HanIR_Chr12g0596761 [Helianthus annuus]KAJ0867521.1 hypothetical protein HanRHA438_Chr12g0564171 [Helianthus annuus]